MNKVAYVILKRKSEARLPNIPEFHMEVRSTFSQIWSQNGRPNEYFGGEKELPRDKNRVALLATQVDLGIHRIPKSVEICEWLSWVAVAFGKVAFCSDGITNGLNLAFSNSRKHVHTHMTGTLTGSMG